MELCIDFNTLLNIWIGGFGSTCIIFLVSSILEQREKNGLNRWGFLNPWSKDNDAIVNGIDESPKPDDHV